ncbi:MAG: cytochrome C biogenesis protein CcdA [Kosmotoga sp.]|nr:MAG: cytochrome C biogenesis protein CcdA [Kosmotoga sp.]
MKKIFCLIIILFSVSIFSSEVIIDYFGVTTCQECLEAEMTIENAKFEVNKEIKVVKHYLSEAKNQELKLKYAKVYGVPEEKYDVYPLIFIGKEVLLPSEIRVENVVNAVENYSEEDRQQKLQEIEELEEDVTQRIKSRYEEFGFFIVLGAGLIDGINPCAFVVLIFLVSYLFYVGRGKNEILIAGLFFAFGLFAAYIAMGTGLLGAVGYLQNISRIFQLFFYPAMAVFTGLLAILSINDFFRMKYKGKKGVLELTPGLKRKTHEIIRKNARSKTIWIASLVTGLLISFVEFMCTGQVYLPTIVYVINSVGVSPEALGFLIIYNLGFVVPVIGITLVAYYTSSIKKIQEFMKSTEAAAKVKLVLGGLFAVFCIIMVNISINVFR